MYNAAINFFCVGNCCVNLSQKEIDIDVVSSGCNDNSLQKLTRTILLTTNADSVSIVTHTNNKILRLFPSFKSNAERYPSEVDASNCIGLASLIQQTPLYINNTEHNGLKEHTDQKIQAFALEPFRFNNENFAICCTFSEPNEFDQNFRNALASYRDLITSIITNNLLSKDCNNNSISNEAIITTINKVQHSQSFGYDDTLLDRLLIDVLELSQSDIGFIGFVNESDSNCDATIKELAFQNKGAFFHHDKVIEFPFDFSDSVLSSVILDGTPRHINKLNNTTQKAIKAIFPQHYKSIFNFMCMPIFSRSQVLGVLILANRQNGYSESISEKIELLMPILSLCLKQRKYDDVTASYEDEINHSRTIDPLSRLPNLEYFLKFVEQKYYSNKSTDNDSSFRAESQFTLCIVDIIQFSTINATYSRAAGDIAIMKIAEFLKNAVSSNDFVARYFGDSFIIAFEGLVSQDIINEIINKATQPFNIGEDLISLDFNIGVAYSPITGDRASASKLIRLTSKSLEDSRDSGNLAIASIYREDARVKQSLLLHDFNFGIEHGQFELYGLPSFDLTDNSISGIEILSRWNHPEKGVLSPAEFFYIIENNTSSMVNFDYNVIMRTVKVIRDCISNNIDIPMIFINVTPSLLMSTEVMSLIKYFSALPKEIISKICFEIIEWQTCGNDEVVCDILTEFKEIGVTIALDDFGTGFSSMDRIKTFPSDIIKIDKSFVETIDNAEDPNPLIESLIQLSQSYEKMIIVEGVETKEQLIKVKNLGCNHAQGFLFEKPTPIESIIKRFKH